LRRIGERAVERELVEVDMMRGEVLAVAYALTSVWMIYRHSLGLWYK
jgi:hypothetical protein